VSEKVENQREDLEKEERIEKAKKQREDILEEKEKIEFNIYF